MLPWPRLLPSTRPHQSHTREVWKLRVQEFLCGDEMLQWITLFNMAAILRRFLLSIFSAGYRIVREAEFGEVGNPSKQSCV